MEEKMKLSSVAPSIDIGRCEVCGTELATRILRMEHIHDFRFCDKCWTKFARLVMNESGGGLAEMNVVPSGTMDGGMATVIFG